MPQAEAGQSVELGPHRQVLLALAQALTRQPDLAQSLGRALAELEARLALSPSRVYALRRGGRLLLLASHGLSPEQAAEMAQVELGRGFTGLAAQRRRMVVMPVDHLDHPGRREMLEKAGMKAVCALPLLLHGELVGVLNVASRLRVGFTPDEQGFLEVLAGLLAAAVAAQVRQERLALAQEELTQTRNEIEMRVAEQVGEFHQDMDGLSQATRRLQDTWNLVMQAERTAAVARFTSAIAHELRNPFMVIGGFAKRLASAMPPEDPRSHYARVIMEEIQQLELMLEEVFKLNRERDLDLAEVEAAKVLEEAFNRASASSCHVRPEPAWELPAQALYLVTDRDLLVRGLGELIANALEVTKDCGRVHLSVRAEGLDRVVFGVGDEGPGISPQERQRIFDPLYTTKDYGVGLGMSLCRDVVLLLGGSLRVDDRPGGGALMEVTIPVHPPETSGSLRPSGRRS